jgi:class 3 adenylate cyclase/CHASE2 domain-containing sensor protein
MRALILLLWTLLLLSMPSWPVLRRLEWTLYDLRWATSRRNLAMDPRLLVVGVEPASYQSIADHPVFWLSHFTRAARRALEQGALVVGLDFLPTYADPQALPEFLQLVSDYPDRLVVAAYWDSEGSVTTPPKPLLFGLGVQNLALANLSLEEDAIGRVQATGQISALAHGRDKWSFFAATLAARCGINDIPERVWVDFSQDSPRRLAFHDFLQQTQDLKGSVVLIGSRSKVDQDIVLTPRRQWNPGLSLSQTSFGVDYQAQVLNTLLQGSRLQPLASWKVGLLLAPMLALLGLAVKRFRLLPSALALLLGLCTWWALGQWLLLSWDRLLPITPGWLGLPASWALALGYHLRREAYAKQALQRTMAGYVSPDILKEMLADPKTWLQSLTQRRQVTVLFSDINNFSTVSEAEPPERVAEWLNLHYREMARVIFENQGTIIRFVGDQFMVLFGSPKPVERPEAAAVRTALAMHRRLQELKSQGQPGFFEVKIGIHCGSLLLAVIGDDLKRDYTAIGDEANLAARIQDLCKKVGVATLVSQDIRDRCGDEFPWVDQGSWPVKGRQQEVRVYSVEA